MTAAMGRPCSNWPAPGMKPLASASVAELRVETDDDTRTSSDDCRNLCPLTLKRQSLLGIAFRRPVILPALPVVPATGRLMTRYLRLAATAFAVLGCSETRALVQPPASEYTAARFELATTQRDTIQGAAVSQEFFRIIGVQPVLGRLF